MHKRKCCHRNTPRPLVQCEMSHFHPILGPGPARDLAVATPTPLTPAGRTTLSRTSVAEEVHCCIRAWLTAATWAAVAHAALPGPPRISTPAAASAARSAAARARWLARTALASTSPEIVNRNTAPMTPSMTNVVDPRSSGRRRPMHWAGGTAAFPVMRATHLTAAGPIPRELPTRLSSHAARLGAGSRPHGVGTPPRPG